jgi:hypothetical protein
MNNQTTETPAGHTTASLKHSFVVIKGDEKTVIKIRLDDQCRNGHEDFSLTCDIYEKVRGIWRDVGGGCAHDHILKLRPELAPFAVLHLCDFNGLPMHCAANALYWFAGIDPAKTTQEYHGGSGSGAKSPDECRRIFAEYIHATPEQVAEVIRREPRTELELRAVLEDMGFIAQWKAEADAAIATLEQWTDQKFAPANPAHRWKAVTAEERAEIEARKASGYYEPAQVAARDAAAAAAERAKKIKQIDADLAASTEKANRNAKVARYMAARYYPRLQNFIYYDHTNTVSFNWSNTEKIVTREEFDAFNAEMDAAALPAGIKTEWAARPKY